MNLSISFMFSHLLIYHLFYCSLGPLHLDIYSCAILLCEKGRIHGRLGRSSSAITTQFKKLTDGLRDGLTDGPTWQGVVSATVNGQTLPFPVKVPPSPHLAHPGISHDHGRPSQDRLDILVGLKETDGPDNRARHYLSAFGGNG